MNIKILEVIPTYERLNAYESGYTYRYSLLVDGKSEKLESDKMLSIEEIQKRIEFRNKERDKEKYLRELETKREKGRLNKKEAYDLLLYNVSSYYKDLIDIIYFN